MIKGKLPSQVMAFYSDLSLSQPRRQIIALIVYTALILACGCEKMKGAEGGTVMNEKEFSQSDFQKLRWIEGTWRGSDGGKEFFYEGYRFLNETAIEIVFYTDASLTKISGKGMVKLSEKAIINGDESSSWISTSLDERSVHFAPKRNVRNSFSWEKESADVWIARLIDTDAQGRRTEKVYRMERYKAQ